MAITINNTFSALTGGLEETDSTTGTIDTPIGTHLGASGFHFSLGSGNNKFDVNFFDSVSDAGNKYCVGVWFRSTSTDTSGTEQFLGIGEVSATVLRVIEVRQSATTFKLQFQFNSGGSSPVGPTVFNNDTWYFMEVFFEHADPGVAELWVGTGIGTSTQEISVTGKDMDGGGAIIDVTYSSSAGFGRDFDMGYLASGATAASDLLGDLEIFMFPTVKTGSTPDAGGLGLAGTAAGAGVWENTADTPLDDTTDVEYTATNSGGSVDTIALDLFLEKDDDNIYCFDGSDAAPDDPDSVWNNDVTAADCSLASSASTTTAGTNSTNELFIEGTNAPSSGHVILDVEARVYGSSVATGVLSTEIFTDGRGESLGVLINLPGNNQWGAWKLLTTPSGGWTWAKIQALESATWASSSSGTSRYFKIEINVAEKLAIDGDSNIIAIKGVWHLDRDGGGGTTHSILLGDSNDGDSPAATTVSLTTTPTSYAVFRTTNLPQVSVANEAIRQGAWTGGAQDIHIYEMWAMVAHVPSAGGATTEKSISFTFTTTMVLTPPVPTRVLAANVGFATAISLERKAGKLIAMPFVTGIAVEKKITPIAKAVAFVTSMVTTPVKIGVKAINIAFGTAFSLAKTVKLAIPIAFVTAMSLTPVKTAFKSIAVGFTTAITVAKKISMTKTVSFVTSMSLATLFIAGTLLVTKTINVAFGTAFTVAKTVKLTKAMNFVTAMVLTRITSFFRTFAVAFGTVFAVTRTTKLAKAISFVTSFSVTAVQLILRNFNVAFVTAMSTTPVPIFVRAFNVTFGTTMSLAKTVKKNIAVAFNIAFSLARKVSVTKAVAFVTTMALTTALLFTRTFSVAFATGMTLTKRLELSQAFSVAFTTSMSLVKKVFKTFNVGFATGFGLVKKTLVNKSVSFVTGMATALRLDAVVAASVSFVTTMVTTPTRLILKAISVAFVTAMSTATNFTAGSGVFGRVLWLLRRRRR